MLMSMNVIKAISQAFSLIALAQLKLRLRSIQIVKSKSAIKNPLSIGLPDSRLPPPCPNQTPNGLQETESIHNVGIHKTGDTSGDCLVSYLSNEITKTVTQKSAINAGNFPTPK